MLHISRCGSTVLGDLLDQHPQIVWDKEIYAERWQEAGMKFQRFNNERFLRNRMLKSGHHFYGFEFKFLPNQHLAIAHTDLPTCLRTFVHCGVSHFIVLERRNYLRVLVSALVGRIRRVRHIAAGTQAELTRVRLNVGSFSFGEASHSRSLLAWLDCITHSYQDLRTLLSGYHVLNVCYEDDMRDDPRIAFDRCCEFLGVPTCEPRVRFSLTNPFRLDQILCNFAEVEQTLRGTKHEWMLTG